ncbi:hypothetical protein ACQP2Y_31230 [Actinoplanes sp. CA-051413]|jgi:hypothetical protein
MEGVALLLSVQVTRRTSHSALPGAEVQVHRERWRWARAVVRRVARGRA